ncbi:MAG: hypothetical protein FJX72_01225, partial [Armatimonadetes bacterium]|nr:hypothetical protein [Armatimonadota bacterium]
MTAAPGFEMANTNHYDTLGVQPHATADEVKRRFRELARLWHPDVAHAPDASERFKAINEAYRVLGDAERRAHYDSELKLARARSASTASPRAAASTRTASTTPHVAHGERERPTGQRPRTRRPFDADPSRTYVIGRLLDDAQAAMGRMRLNEAARFCRAVLELDRRNATAHEMLGDIFRLRGRTDEALAHYTMAIQSDPVNYTVRAKFERLAYEPDPAGPGRSTGAGAAFRQAVLLMLGLGLIGLMIVYLVAEGQSPTIADAGWAPWDWSLAAILGLP